ncbi:APC family permease [Parasphingopyxis sp. CP4]|uniref:APC family permease n=1 Tax=Parasphingopyxis sp. CP4 TaxID=2724527 RepID=UPI00351A8C2B
MFALPGRLDAAVGSFAPWLILIFGFLFTSIVICFADLARYFDRTGGAQLYAGTAFGPVVGFQTGWLLYLSRVAALGANTMVLVAYAGALWPVLNDPVASSIASVVVLVTFTAINVIGVKRAMEALSGFTILKLLPLIGLVIWGLFEAAPAPQFQLPEFTAVESIALVALYAFVGFEGANVPAGEMRDAKRTLPKAMITTIILATLFYFAIQWVYTNSAGSLADTETPLVALAEHYIGPTGAIVLGLAAVFSIAGNVMAGVVSAPRMTFGLAEDGLLPRWFAHISPRFGTPDRSILFYGGLGLVVALSGTFVLLAIVTSLARLLSYLLCIAALTVIRKRAGLDTFASIWAFVRHWGVPAVATAMCLWAASQSTFEAWRVLGLFVVLGALLYWIARYSLTKAGPDNEELDA